MDDVHLAFRHLLVFENFLFQCFHPGLETPFSLSDNSFRCIFSSLMYGLMISAREFSSDGPDEDIATQS
jgi:hypothetical protein